MQRPDLSQVSLEVLEYIEYLEGEIERGGRGRVVRRETSGPVAVDEKPVLEPAEAPTTINLITATRLGLAKRTPRHQYLRQRRSGMGSLDMELPSDQSPSFLVMADESQSLILFTNLARAFRLPVSRVAESPFRAPGEFILDRLPLEPGEHLAAVLPDQATGYVVLVSQRGMVRSLRHHLFGEYLKPGTAFYNYREFGPLAAACWSPGDGDLLLATRSGLGIRFNEKTVPPQGILGMKVDPADQVVSVAPVYDDSGVFLVGADGRGTVRKMSGFNPNKSPGGSGKFLIRTDHLVAALTVEPVNDLFLASSLGKVIRFSAAEVPDTEGTIQGAICMGLRGDEVNAAARSTTVSTITYRAV